MDTGDQINGVFQNPYFNTQISTNGSNNFQSLTNFDHRIQNLGRKCENDEVHRMEAKNFDIGNPK